MNNRISISAIISILLIFVSCSGLQNAKELSEAVPEEAQPVETKRVEPHQYGGWYCPDNFGFVPVDIQKLDEIPAIANRLPTEEELKANMSLIKVDTAKYPDARALEMDLPRVASVYMDYMRRSELAIVIQAIVVQEDTVVGYRFPNGGNGSAWLKDVKFLSEDEVAAKGPQPFFYSNSVVKASTKDIWGAITKTDYFKQLGEKFDQKAFFSSEWNPDARVHLHLDSDGEKAKGSVGMAFGNYYMHIDYYRDGFHYSEKMLIMEDQEDNTTEFFFASGPFPKDFKKQKTSWNNWFEAVEIASEAYGIKRH
ncbi:MAG: hypothetical protein AB8F95_11965 [Bacteroidia bacterium]